MGGSGDGGNLDTRRAAHIASQREQEEATMLAPRNLSRPNIQRYNTVTSRNWAGTSEIRCYTRDRLDKGNAMGNNDGSGSEGRSANDMMRAYHNEDDNAIEYGTRRDLHKIGKYAGEDGLGNFVESLKQVRKFTGESHNPTGRYSVSNKTRASQAAHKMRAAHDAGIGRRCDVQLAAIARKQAIADGLDFKARRSASARAARRARQEAKLRTRLG